MLLTVPHRLDHGVAYPLRMLFPANRIESKQRRRLFSEGATQRVPRLVNVQFRGSKQIPKATVGQQNTVLEREPRARCTEDHVPNCLIQQMNYRTAAGRIITALGAYRQAIAM